MVTGRRFHVSVRDLRLATGLTMAAFVLSHLLNHALGLASLAAMEAWRQVHSAIWQSPPGMVALYGAFAVHFFLALYSLYHRNHLRMPVREAVRIAFGLLMPLLLLDHVVGSRVIPAAFDFDATYAYTISFLWLDRLSAWQQTALILVVWTHLCIGLYFWLRIKPWYQQFSPVFHAFFVLVPVVSWLGFARAGMEVEGLATRPGWLAATREGLVRAPREALDAYLQLVPIGMALFLATTAMVLLARYLRTLYQRRHGTLRIRYPGGRVATVPVGLSILETSQMQGIPHASVCGGRGRCTTCRVQVVEGCGDLDPPSELEAKALARIQAAGDVRLACQTRPHHDITILPLLPPTATAQDGRRPGGLQGQERPVAVLFVDIRGSTRLGEERLPYDVVFILNQFFAEMADALNATNGHYAQFNGDGLMAIYGLSCDVGQACRDAIAGAVEMQRRLRRLNRAIAGELGRELAIGVGVHSGDAIVGSMGPPSSPNISAIGDNVNIAARLEGLTKEFACGIVISAETAVRAGLDLSAYPRHEAALRGRGESIAVYALPTTADPFVDAPAIAAS